MVLYNPDVVVYSAKIRNNYSLYKKLHKIITNFSEYVCIDDKND